MSHPYPTRRAFTAGTAAALLAAPWACRARAAQAHSDAPLRLVLGYPPGGSSDRAARIVADRLQAKLNHPVIVENRPGAGGRLALQQMAQQIRSAEAHTNVLLLANPAVMVVAPLVFKDNGYDAERDFVPLSQVNRYEFAIAVGPQVPVKQLAHLFAWLRANPDKANFGVPATGSLPHFVALMVGDKARVPGQVVGYRGSAPLTTDLLGGQVPVAVDTFDTLLPLHEAGKLNILAISSAQRSPFAPRIPTFKEAGIDLTATGWNAFFAPVNMPAAESQRLGQLIREVMQERPTQRKFTDAKMVPIVSGPADTAQMLRAYRAQWAPVVQRSGYQP